MATEPLTPAEHYAEGMEQLAEASHQNVDRTERQIHAARAQAHFLGGLLAVVMEEQARAADE